MKNDRYADIICNDCASSVGATMPHSHIATYNEDICEGCGYWKIVASTRDFRFPKIKKIQLNNENRDRIVKELRETLTKYQCQGNAGAVDEIRSRIAEYMDENH